MRVVVVAVILAVGVIALFWVGETLNFGGLTVLLVVIPVSLALFTFLWHRRHEQLKAEEQDEQEKRSRV